MELLVQMINEVRSMETQIMDYIQLEMNKKQILESEIRENYEKSLQQKKEIIILNQTELSKLKYEEEQIFEKIQKIKSKILKIDDENKVNINCSIKWENLKNSWELKLNDQEERYKKLSDLNRYLSEKFKLLNLEYNNVIAEKKNLNISKDNLEKLLEKSKREFEKKICELNLLNKEIKNEFEIEKQEFDRINMEINRSKNNNDLLEEKVLQLKHQITKLEKGLISILEEIVSKKEFLLKSSEKLDKKKLETNELLDEFCQYTKYISEIKNLNLELDSIKNKLETFEKKDEEKNVDKLMEAKHINEANKQLEYEISLLKSNIKIEEEYLIEEISKMMKLEKKSICMENIDSLLLDLEKMANENNKLELIIDNNCDIETSEIIEQINKIKLVLDYNNFSVDKLNENINKKGKLKRNKKKNTFVLEELLIQSLKLIKKVDGDIDKNLHIDQNKKNEIQLKENQLQIPKNKISTIGRRILTSNRKLLTPRKVSRTKLLI